MTSLGVPLGAKMPFQDVTSKDWMPLSWTVGTSGSAGERAARGRDRARPAIVDGRFDCCIVVDHEVDVVPQRPYQEIRRLPVRDDGEVHAGRGLEQLRRKVLAAADVDGAEVRPSSLSRAAVTTSVTVRNGDCAFVTMTKSKKATLETGVKSVSGSNGSFLNKGTLIAVPLVRRAKVYPSASRLENFHGRDDTAGAGLVLDDDLLAEFARKLLGDDPQAGVGDPPGAERHDNPNRLRRIRRTALAALSCRGPVRTRRKACRCQQEGTSG